MIATPTSLRRIGWAAVLAVCCALLFGLSLKVNALKSEVRLTERRILALKRETMYLETEYETRANQQQLAAWNSTDFGYIAPGPGQYFESERQLSALGKPAGPGAPAPIRVAAAIAAPPPGILPQMVSPLTGMPLGDEDEAGPAEPAPVDHDKAAAALGARLARVDRGELVRADKPAKPKTVAEAKRP